MLDFAQTRFCRDDPIDESRAVSLTDTSPVATYCFAALSPPLTAASVMISAAPIAALLSFATFPSCLTFHSAENNKI